MAIHPLPPAPTHAVLIKHADDGCYLGAPLLQDYETGKQVVDETNNSVDGASFFRTCCNGLNALAGVGILSIPYALSEGGWLSFTLLLAVALICCYTGLLLQRCMNANSHIKTYPDIGEYAFGFKGRLAISIFMYVELYLVAIEFLILEGDNMDKLFLSRTFELGAMKIEGKKFFTILAALIFCPTTWTRNLSAFAYVSAAGVIASLAVVGSVVWIGTSDIGFHEQGKVLSLSGLPTALGLYAFCYCGHAVFPSLCTSMKNKSQFPKVLYICFLLCTLNYGSMAILGYLMYGDKIQSQITLNLPGGRISTYIAIGTTLINPFTKYALMINPVASAIEDRFLLSSKKSTMFLIRTLLVASTLLVALMVPFFGYVMAFIGSFLSVIVSVLLPCMCYLKIFEEPWRSMSEMTAISVILIAGVAIAITGTYTSLNQIVHNL